MTTTGARPVRVLYTAEGRATGGRHGHTGSTDGRLDVDLSSPSELGGDGGPGTNPEQLFAAGYAACFQNAMMSVARRTNAPVDDSTVTARVGIGPTDDGRFGLTVALEIVLPSIADRAQAEDLVARAHRRCPYSNAVAGNIDVALTITSPPAPEG